MSSLGLGMRCARIWTGSGRDSSPYMYTLHFCYALGCVATPLLAKPFLRGDLVMAGGGGGVWTVRTLYPLIAAAMLVPVPGYIYHFLQDRRRDDTEHCDKEIFNEISR